MNHLAVGELQKVCGVWQLATDSRMTKRRSTIDMQLGLSHITVGPQCIAVAVYMYICICVQSMLWIFTDVQCIAVLSADPVYCVHLRPLCTPVTRKSSRWTCHCVECEWHQWSICCGPILYLSSQITLCVFGYSYIVEQDQQIAAPNLGHTAAVYIKVYNNNR